MCSGTNCIVPSPNTWWSAAASGNRGLSLFESYVKNPSLVYTGSKMIMWGGYGQGGQTSYGGVWDPPTDTWTATSQGANVPEARLDHTAVWTGSKMIIFGGRAGYTTSINTGGQYDPSTNTWTATTLTNAPTARTYNTAVWSGSEMLIFGGEDISNAIFYGDGKKYNPTTNTWTNMAALGVGGRSRHTAVWSGTEMLVWGGLTETPSLGVTNTGYRYNPSTNTWSTMTTTNAPSARADHVAVWTGSEMVVWGGWNYSSTAYNTGGRYNPSTNTWTATTTTGAPTARREGIAAAYVAGKITIWGGYDMNLAAQNSGGVLDTSTWTWTTMTTSGRPNQVAPNVVVGGNSYLYFFGSDTTVAGESNKLGVFKP
jgi:N-acetylneuraminic acid mutarotase